MKMKILQTPIMTLALLFMSAYTCAADVPKNVSTEKTGHKHLEKLNAFFDSLDKNQKLMASVAIRENGELVYQYQVGFADLQNNKLANAASRYRIGSISKTYTAAIVMKLIEEGQLSLNQTLNDFYPQIPLADKITVAQLLSHTSGIFNFTNDPAYLTYMESPKSKAELLSIIQAYPSNFEPGEKFEYSNSNYVLLGFIAEDVTKKTFAALMHEKIILPLGLNDTYFSDGSKSINTGKNDVKSYRYQGEWVEASETNMSIPHGAGAVVSTAADVSLFMHALFNEKIVSGKSLAAMTKKGEYGYGLMSYPFYDKVGFGHNGGIDGFVSNSTHIPSDNVTITVLANGVNYVFNDALIAVLSAHYNKAYDVPVFAQKPAAVGDIDFKLYVGSYASKQLPLKIRVFEEQGNLMAQATGQAAFALERTSQHDFTFNQAGILMEFTPEEQRFVLNQGGAKFDFSIEK